MKFWSDDFDMDLLKVFPQTLLVLGETAELKLWTIGHESYGRLNHPTVWNSHGAYLWLERPNLERDKNGWANIHGCVSNEKEIECTWLEWLRDAWSHHYTWTVLVPPLGERRFPGSPTEAFMRIMYDLRALVKRDVTQERSEGLRWVCRTTETLRACVRDKEKWEKGFRFEVVT